MSRYLLQPDGFFLTQIIIVDKTMPFLLRSELGF